MTRTQLIRAGGIALALGGPVWAVTLLTTDPPVNGVAPTAEILGGLAWQIGVAGLLLAAWLTGALGPGRRARLLLRAEAVLLGLASIWSVVYAIDPATQQHVVMVVLDVTWPLSVLLLVPVGWVVLRARVWDPPLRHLPLVASLWLPLDVAVLLAAGDTAALAFRAAWLTVVWGAVGVLVALRARDLAASGDDAAAQQHSLRSL